MSKKDNPLVQKYGRMIPVDQMKKTSSDHRNEEAEEVITSSTTENPAEEESRAISSLLGAAPLKDLIGQLNRPPENKLVKKYGRMIPVEEMKKARQEAVTAEAIPEEKPKEQVESEKPVDLEVSVEPGIPDTREERKHIVEDKEPVSDYTRDLLPELESLLALEISDMMQTDAEVPQIGETSDVADAATEEAVLTAETPEATPVAETPAEEPAKVEETVKAEEAAPTADNSEVAPIVETPAAEPAKAEEPVKVEEAAPTADNSEVAPVVETPAAEPAKEQEAADTASTSAADPKLDLNKFKVPAAIAAGVLLIGYLGGAHYYQSHFYPNTTLNGVSVSGRSAEGAYELFDQALDSYELKLTGRNGVTDHMSAAQMGLAISWDGSVEETLRGQNGLAWPFKLLTSTDLSAATVAECDMSILRKAVNQLYVMSEVNQIPPEDAAVSQYTEAEGYIVLKEKQGAKVSKVALVQAIRDAASQMTDTLDLDTADVYVKPQIISSDPRLIAAVEKLNEYSKAEITLEVGEDLNVVDGTVIADWLTVDENYEVSFNEEGVSGYVKKLAGKYDTAWDDETITRSYDGKTITVGNCHYGWLVDREAETKALLEEVLNGEKVTRDLHYSMTANSHGPHDYGDSYVEIDLTHQTLWLYYEGKLIITTPFVSGNPSKGNETHTGVFGLMYKERDATLTGQGYSSPVKYWMPFNGNEGMHDASWRNKFGGSLYAYAGSHGCVNLPTAAAATIFDYVEKNYPVIVFK